MDINKWSPLKELEDMRRNMDRLFEEFIKPSAPRRKPWPRHEGIIIPNVDMYDRQNEIVVKVEIPGVSREDIDLTIAKDSLVIKGTIKRDPEVKDEDYYISERACGSFSRSVSLPFEVESEKAQASLINGVLEIVLPKREESKPREIRIEVK